jgi:putative DNA-invertase from lambdoid prophage Rac
LKELAELGIGFVSLTEAFDMTTPTGRALAGMLAVFAEFEREIMRERVKAGIAQARSKGITLGRPKSAAKKISEVKRLYRKEKAHKSRDRKTPRHRPDLSSKAAGGVSERSK